MATLSVNKKLIIVVGILITAIQMHGQNLVNFDPQTLQLEFHSKITGKKQQLQVKLPENYDTNAGIHYPVLYLLDGQNWFPLGVSMHKVFTGNEANFKSIPDFILVGITTQWEQRREFFNSENAFEFIEEEVIKEIDNTFRTTNERLLFGWQFAGGFVLKTLAVRPKLFSGYLAATPVFFDPIELESMFSNNEFPKEFLYISGTEEENETWIQPTLEILSSKGVESFRWVYNEINSFGAFGHRISPIETISYGLRAYFHDYPILEFKNVEAFIEKGGIDFVRAYYQKRAKKYNLPEDMGQWGRYVLVRMALRESHFPTFEELMDEFKKTDFVDRLSIGQIYTIADFYTINHKPFEASSLFQQILEIDQESARALNGLGKVNLTLGNRKKAASFFRKAIRQAEKINDPNLGDYIADLDNMN